MNVRDARKLIKNADKIYCYVQAFEAYLQVAKTQVLAELKGHSQTSVVEQQYDDKDGDLYIDGKW